MRPRLRWGFDRPCCQHAIDDLEQRITTAAQHSVHLMTDGSERFPFLVFHTGSMGARRFLSPLLC